MTASHQTIRSDLCPSPFRYYGSKALLMRKFVPLFPNHDIYVSVFGGSAADIAKKPPSRQEVYNDISTTLTTFFRVVANDEQRSRLIAGLQSLVPSRLLYEDMRAICRDGSNDPVRVAVAFYYCQLWSYGGIDPSARTRRCFTVSSLRPVPYRWRAARQHLIAVGRRFRNVLVENRTWKEIVAKFDHPKSLLYMDPPYHHSTRRSLDGYRHEMSGEDHEELLRALQGVESHVMLSGYDCELYREYLGSWRRVDFPVKCGASPNRAPRIETVWLNYNETGERLRNL